MRRWSVLFIILKLAVVCEMAHLAAEVSVGSDARDKSIVVTASWYGRGFHGRYMANGNRYNMYAISVAHKTLPLGTKLKITNMEHGISVFATVTDRGPYVKGREFDLSYGAARALRIVGYGVYPVKVEYLGREEI